MKRTFLNLLNGVIDVKYHYFRFSLSLIGIILGVMNLSAMFSIIEGAKTANKYIMESIGNPDIISINLDWRKYNSLPDKSYYSLSWQDMENIKRFAATIKNIGVEIQLNEAVKYKEKNNRQEIFGIMPSGLKMNKYEIEDGRPINEIDMENRNKICIIGSSIKNELFPKENPIGKELIIGNCYFQIIGLYKKFGKKDLNNNMENYMDWKNKRILLPATTVERYFIGFTRTRQPVFSIFVQSKSLELVHDSIKEIRNLLLLNHGYNDIFEFKSFLEWQNEADEFTKIWQIVLGVVSGISLLVGGIGIMNVMLASYRERIREIGIRKAVGANNRDIFLLFLVETLVICFSGGFIGLLIGYIISMTTLNQMLVKTFDVPVHFSFITGLMSISFSLLVGIFAGLYPAIKASRLSPVEALRYE